jgi:hypothetical protein
VAVEPAILSLALETPQPLAQEPLEALSLRLQSGFLLAYLHRYLQDVCWVTYTPPLQQQ